MNVKRLSAANFSTSAWPGGSTCELYLYPASGSYAKRDFLFRLSSAVVAQDGAPFTPLPGVRRGLMLLEGQLALEQPGAGRMELERFTPVWFSGGAAVRSFGQGRDFNLMLRGDVRGQLSYIHLKGGEERRLAAPFFGAGRHWKAVYPVQGGVSVHAAGACIPLEPGQMALLWGEGTLEAGVSNPGSPGAGLAMADLFLPEGAGPA